MVLASLVALLMIGGVIGGALLLRIPKELVLPATSPTPSERLALSPSPSSAPTDLTVSLCGRLTRYASDGAHMLLTLEVGTTSRLVNLQYQFARTPPPSDIGDRNARGDTQFLQIDGRRRPPDSSASSAITLDDWTLVRVAACP